MSAQGSSVTPARRGRSAITALVVVATLAASGFGLAGCGDAKVDQDNTGHPVTSTSP